MNEANLTKTVTRILLSVGLSLFALLGVSGLGQSPSPPVPAPFQVGFAWPAQTAGSGSFGAFGVTGLRYFSVDWVVAGTVSACTVTLDGATSIGGSFTTGSIVGSQSCTSSGSFTTSSVSQNVQAQLSYNLTGTGTVTFIVRGYALNPATSGQPCL